MIRQRRQNRNDARPVENNDYGENMENFKIKVKIVGHKVREELKHEWDARVGNRYKLLCSNGDLPIGRHVLPFISGFFSQQIDMIENLKPYDSNEGPTEIDCKVYPVEIVTLFLDGIYGKELDICVNDAIQLIRFIHGPGNYEMYDWHKRSIDKILKELDAQCLPLFALARGQSSICIRRQAQFPTAAFHDKYLDVIFAMTRLSIDCDDKIKAIAKQFTKQEFESAFGRLIIKAHSFQMENRYGGYIRPNESLTFMLYSSFPSGIEVDLTEERNAIIAEFTEIAKNIGDNWNLPTAGNVGTSRAAGENRWLRPPGFELDPWPALQPLPPMPAMHNVRFQRNDPARQNNRDNAANNAGNAGNIQPPRLHRNPPIAVPNVRQENNERRPLQERLDRLDRVRRMQERLQERVRNDDLIQMRENLRRQRRRLANANLNENERAAAAADMRRNVQIMYRRMRDRNQRRNNGDNQADNDHNPVFIPPAAGQDLADPRMDAEVEEVRNEQPGPNEPAIDPVIVIEDEHGLDAQLAAALGEPANVRNLGIDILDD
jgi:hypothetical protein